MKSSKAFSHGAASVDLPSEAEPMFFAELRITFGVVMITHGIPKAMRASHGSMADPWSGSINLIQNVMDLPFAPQLAFVVMLLETLGAAMLILGLLPQARIPGKKHSAVRIE